MQVSLMKHAFMNAEDAERHPQPSDLDLRFIDILCMC